MNHAHLGHLARTTGTIGGHYQIHPGSAEPDQLPEGRWSPSGRGSPYRFEAEAGHDSMNQLAVAMLADQNVCLGTTVDEGHHELPSMPEGDDQMASSFIQVVNLAPSFGSDPEGPAQESNSPGPQRGKDRQFNRIPHRE